MGWHAYTSFKKSSPIILAKHFIQRPSLINLRRASKLIANADGYYWKDVTDPRRSVGKVISMLGVHDGSSGAAPMVGLIAGEIYHAKCRSGTDSSRGIAKFLLVGKDDIGIAVFPQWQKQFEVSSYPSNRMADILIGNVQLKSSLLHSRRPIRATLKAEGGHDWTVSCGLNINDFDPRSFRRLQLLVSRICGFSGFISGSNHFLPLITSNNGISQDNKKSTERDPSASRFPEPLYLLASIGGIVVFGYGWLTLRYSAGGSSIIFWLANAAIPIGVILCLYGFNGLLRLSVGF